MIGQLPPALRAPARIFAFWLIAGITFYGLDVSIPWMDIGAGRATVVVAMASWTGGDGQAATDAVSSPAFIGTLVWSIVAFGAALLAAFAITHVLYVRVSMRSAARIVRKYKGRPEFASAYEVNVLPALRRHGLIGHAWKEFDETLVRLADQSPQILQNTVRPQVFINYSLAREKLTGLKIIGSISGYFVGIGLLLTFIGIVIALSTAASSVGSHDAKQMTTAMEKLLGIASLKFSTSIAGLGVSIVFAFVARWFVIWIEGAFSSFCEAVEERLLYTAPQAIAAEMNAVAKEQRDELKELNSDRYFTRLAEAVEASMTKAIMPMTTGFGSAVEELKKSSVNTGSDMAQQISDSLRGSAGTEMQQIGETLRQIQTTLETTRGGLQGSGEDFGRRLTEAAEGLSRLVSEAGSKLEGSAAQSRDSLTQVVEALRTTLEQANTKVEHDLGNAASGASNTLNTAMTSATSRLEQQVATLVEGLQQFEAGSSSTLSGMQDVTRQAQAEAVASLSSISTEASRAMQSGLTDALRQIAEEVERFRQAMAAGGAALSHQATAIGDATSQTRSVADAFARTAQDVRAASAPLIHSGERMAQATAELGTTIAGVVNGMEAANLASTQLSQSLTTHTERLGSMWEGYKQQFERIDEDLAKAVDKLAETNSGQAEILTRFVLGIDRELAGVINKLGAFISEFSENTDSLSISAESLAKTFDRQAAE